MSLLDSSIVAAEWEPLGEVPPKSQIMDYGYVIKGQPIGCSRRGLIESVGRRKSEISFVWTPETPAPVRPEQVPFLVEAFRRAEARDARSYLWCGAALVVVGAVLALVSEDWAGFLRYFLFLVGGSLLAAGNWKYWYTRNYSQEDAANDASEGRFFNWIKKRSVSGYTITLITAMVVVSALMGLVGNSIEVAGLVKPAVWRGEVWRLFTATLIHTQFNHLWMTGVALFSFSKVAEQTIHRAFVPVLYLVTAVVGGVFSVLLAPHTTSVGITSGGIMGLLGFIAMAGYFDRTKYPPRYFKRVITLTALFGTLGLFGIPIVDNAAHLGGLVSGVMLGWICTKVQPTQHTGMLWRVGSVASILAVISTAAFAIYRIVGGG